MNILIHSNSVTGRYGYSVVFNEVAKGLAKEGHKVYYFGMQTMHPPFKDNDDVVWLGLRYDSFGSDMMENYVRMYKIDAIITGWDVWLPQAQYIPQVTQKYNIPWICHTTINSSPLSPNLYTPFSYAQYLVAPSKYNVDELVNVGFNNVTYVPHGVDLSIYSKKKIKKASYIEGNRPETVFLSVMRNKGYQKNYPALFYAYKTFIENVPEAKEKTRLYILSDPIEPDAMPLDTIRSRIGMQNNIRFIWAKPKSGEDCTIVPTFEGDPEGCIHNANMNFSSEEMAKIYNGADIHVISSAGESFGLPTLESMACGLPQIFPNNSTGPELVGKPKTGFLADIKYQSTTPLSSDTHLVDIMSLAKCMHKLYSDKVVRADCSKNALKHAENYEINKVVKMWSDLVKKVEEDEKKLDYGRNKLGV